MFGELDRLVDRALHALASDDPIAPPPLRLLLRRYAMTGRADLEAVLGPALARALDASTRESADAERSAWLVLFVQAAAISHDERVREAVAELAADVVREWSVEAPRRTVDAAMRSIDACFQAADLFSGEERAEKLIVEAVEALERVVGPQYRPGEGVGHIIGDPAGIRGRLRDQVATASALLAAHAWTGRLPYSMLAEELMQFALRSMGGPRPEGPIPPSDGPIRVKPDPTGLMAAESFVAACEAVSVFCRLAALHANPDYRDSAVIAEDVDYAFKAEAVLRSLSDASRSHDIAVAAEYGLALSDLLSLRQGH